MFIDFNKGDCSLYNIFIQLTKNIEIFNVQITRYLSENSIQYFISKQGVICFCYCFGLSTFCFEENGKVIFTIFPD